MILFLKDVLKCIVVWAFVTEKSHMILLKEGCFELHCCLGFLDKEKSHMIFLKDVFNCIVLVFQTKKNHNIYVL